MKSKILALSFVALAPLAVLADGASYTYIDLNAQIGGSADGGFFNVDTTPFPTVKRIAATCLALEPFAKAHPLKQPGAPASVGH